ncbi:MAG: diacylglycerol kinase family lipid kinase [Lentimicrobiaceae bacterium]|nr:diacylglycerol kinase family lipid kinase [Lentimicrobiaceae bacterium]
MKQNVVFIVNPKAGVIPKNKSFIDFVTETAFPASKFNVEVKMTSYQGNAKELAEEAKSNGADIVVSVGGDGTLNEIATNLVGSDVSLGIVPAGSGNGLAHYLKIPSLLSQSLRVISAGKTKKIDVGKVNDNMFLSIAGVGFDAHVANLFQHQKIRGLISYLKVILQEYPTYEPKYYDIKIDDKTIIRKEALMVVVANSNQFGFNAKIAPKARIDDGLLNLCVFDKIPHTEILTVLYSLTRGKKIKKYASYYKVRNVSIVAEDPSVVNIDGDPISMEMPLNYSVLKRKLKIIVP